MPQNITIDPIPGKAAMLYKSMLRKLTGKQKKFVKQKSKQLSEGIITKVDISDFAVLGDISGQDTAEIIFIIMMEAAKSAKEDLQAIMDWVKKMNEEKEKRRKESGKLPAGNEEGKSDDRKVHLEVFNNKTNSQRNIIESRYQMFLKFIITYTRKQYADNRD